MRENKFRAKTLSGEWVYGYYFEGFTGISYILVLHDHILGMTEFYEVIPATVGQYTGIKDKNGTEIYECDVVRYWGGEYCQGFWEYKGVVTVDITDYSGLMMMGEVGFIEVIGNIHENSDLQEVVPCSP